MKKALGIGKRHHHDKHEKVSAEDFQKLGEECDGLRDRLEDAEGNLDLAKQTARKLQEDYSEEEAEVSKLRTALFNSETKASQPEPQAQSAAPVTQDRTALAACEARISELESQKAAAEERHKASSTRLLTDQMQKVAALQSAAELSQSEAAKQKAEIESLKVELGDLSQTSAMRAGEVENAFNSKLRSARGEIEEAESRLQSTKKDAEEAAQASAVQVAAQLAAAAGAETECEALRAELVQSQLSNEHFADSSHEKASQLSIKLAAQETTTADMEKECEALRVALAESQLSSEHSASLDGGKSAQISAAQFAAHQDAAAVAESECAALRAKLAESQRSFEHFAAPSVEEAPQISTAQLAERQAAAADAERENEVLRVELAEARLPREHSDSPADKQGHTVDLEESRGMPLKGLKENACQLGVDQEALGDVDGQDNPKEVVIKLIVKKALQLLVQLAAQQAAAADAEREREALRAELAESQGSKEHLAVQTHDKASPQPSPQLADVEAAAAIAQSECEALRAELAESQRSNERSASQTDDKASPHPAPQLAIVEATAASAERECEALRGELAESQITSERPASLAEESVAKTLETRCHDLLVELHEAQEATNNSEDEVARYTVDIERFKTELGEFSEKVSSVDVGNTEGALQSEFELARKDLEEAESRLHSARKDAEEASQRSAAQLAAQLVAAADAESECEALRVELADARLSSDLSANEKVAEVLEAQCYELNTELHNTEEAASSTEAEAARQQIEIENHKIEIEELSEKIAASELAGDTENALHSELEASRKEVEEAESQLQSVRKDAEEASQRSAAQLAAQLVAAADADSECESLRIELVGSRISSEHNIANLASEKVTNDCLREELSEQGNVTKTWEVRCRELADELHQAEQAPSGTEDQAEVQSRLSELELECKVWQELQDYGDEEPPFYKEVRDLHSECERLKVSLRLALSAGSLAKDEDAQPRVADRSVMPRATADFGSIPWRLSGDSLDQSRESVSLPHRSREQSAPSFASMSVSTNLEDSLQGIPTYRNSFLEPRSPDTHGNRSDVGNPFSATDGGNPFSGGNSPASADMLRSGAIRDEHSPQFADFDPPPRRSPRVVSFQDKAGDRHGNPFPDTESSPSIPADGCLSHCQNCGLEAQELGRLRGELQTEAKACAEARAEAAKGAKRQDNGGDIDALRALREALRDQEAKNRRLCEHACRAEESRRRLYQEMMEDSQVTDADAHLVEIAKQVGKAAQAIAAVTAAAPRLSAGVERVDALPTEAPLADSIPPLARPPASPQGQIARQARSRQETHSGGTLSPSRGRARSPMQGRQRSPVPDGSQLFDRHPMMDNAAWLCARNQPDLC